MVNGSVGRRKQRDRKKVPLVSPVIYASVNGVL